MSTPLLTKAPQADLENITSDETIRCQIIGELKRVAQIGIPMFMMALALYSKNVVSAFFLSKQGQLNFAAGSLGLSIANVFGYSIIFGLANGIEPICGQAFGARRLDILGLTLLRSVIFLLLVSFGISMLWVNMETIAIWLRLEEEIAIRAQTYLFYSMLDLFAQSLLHPLRIFLRSQSIINPLFYCAFFSIVLHFPITWFLVSYMNIGIGGVALGIALTDCSHVISLFVYIFISGACKETWPRLTLECLRGWRPLIDFAIPSCLSTCLEWWFYEILLFFCGSLDNAETAISAMGILIQFTGLIYNFPSALSSSVSTRVSNELGANQPGKAKLAVKMAIACSFAMGVFSLIVTVLARSYWSKWFSMNQEVLELTATAMIVIGLCEIGNCPQTTGCGVLRGAARPKLGMYLNGLCFYSVGFPVALWFGLHRGFGLIGFLFGLLAAQGTCAAAMMVVLYGIDWKEQAKKAKVLTNGDSVGGDFIDNLSSCTP